MRTLMLLLAGAMVAGAPAQKLEPVRERSLRLLVVRWSALDMAYDADQLARLDRVRSRPTEDTKDDETIAQLIARTLTARQRARWEELSLQYSGLAAAGLPSVARRLGLDESRRRDFARAGEQAWARMEKQVAKLYLPPAPTNFDDERALGIRRLRRFIVECVRARELDRLDEALLTRLTPAQRTQWASMLGVINEDVRHPVPAGGIPAYPEYRLLGETSVQRDLGLDEDAIRRISALLKRASMLFDVPGIGREESQVQVARIHRLTDRHLTPRQQTRLRQITAQVFGLSLVRNPDYAREIGLRPNEIATFRVALGRELRDQRIEQFQQKPTPNAPRQSPALLPRAGSDFLAERAVILAAQERRTAQTRRMNRVLRAALSPARLEKIRIKSGAPHQGADRLRSLYAPL